MLLHLIELILINIKYTLNNLKDVGLGIYILTPLPKGHKFTSNDVSLLIDPDRHRRLVGQLLYLNLTRLDIAYAIQQLSRFVNTPRQHHWDAAINVL